MGKVSAAGMWMKTSKDQSVRPASRTSTRFAGSAERRAASTQPAEPPPTMMKSYCRSVIWSGMLTVAPDPTSTGVTRQDAAAWDSGDRGRSESPPHVDRPLPVRRIVELDPDRRASARYGREPIEHARPDAGAAVHPESGAA